MASKTTISRRKLLSLTIVATGGYVFSSCNPSIPTPNPTAIITATAEASATPEPTPTSTPTPTSEPTITPTPILEIEIRGKTIGGKEINGDIPQFLLDQVERIVERRELTGNVYAQEAYASINGEDMLLLVKENGGKWLISPYGLGLPHKDAIFWEWGQSKDDPVKKGWNELPIASDTEDVAEKKVKILGLIELCKKQEPEHPGEANMYLQDIINFGMQVVPGKEKGLFDQAVDSFLNSSQTSIDGFWIKNGGRPASVKEFQTKIQSKSGGPLQKPGWMAIEYMGQNGAGSRTLVRTEAYLTEIGIIIFTQRDIRENPFTNIFINKLLYLDNHYIGQSSEGRSQMIGFGIDPLGRLLWVCGDTNARVWAFFNPDQVGIQTVGDENGVPTANSTITVTALWLLTIRYNRKFYISPYGNWVPDIIYKAEGYTIFTPVVLFEDVKDPVFQFKNFQE